MKAQVSTKVLVQAAIVLWKCHNSLSSSNERTRSLKKKETRLSNINNESARTVRRIKIWFAWSDTGKSSRWCFFWRRFVRFYGVCLVDNVFTRNDSTKKSAKTTDAKRWWSESQEEACARRFSFLALFHPFGILFNYHVLLHQTVDRAWPSIPHFMDACTHVHRSCIVLVYQSTMHFSCFPHPVPRSSFHFFPFSILPNPLSSFLFTSLPLPRSALPYSFVSNRMRPALCFLRVRRQQTDGNVHSPSAKHPPRMSMVNSLRREFISGKEIG